jgi:protein-tyrosine phosphatase
MATTTFVDIFSTSDYPREVMRAAKLLQDGGLVVLPTETVYGVAGVLSHPSAKQRLKDFRGTGDKPFTIHLGHRDQAFQLLGPVNDLGKRMMKKLWPGPVGLIFEVPADRRAAVAKELNLPESDLYDGSTITLRCPDHAITTDILAEVDQPVVLTVASSGGSDSAHRVDQFAKEVDGKVELVIDAGPSQINKPSTLVRVYDDRYEIVRAGIYDERIIERLMRTTVLFVCSGNTCRSPMAEAIARRVLSDKLNVTEADLEKKGINVTSAGASAMFGARAAEPAIEAVKTLGADLSKHRSKPLTVELIHEADVIFTMSRSHAQAVAALVPSAAEKTMTLDPSQDIEDPIGGDLSLYNEVATQLKSLIEKRLPEKILT